MFRDVQDRILTRFQGPEVLSYVSWGTAGVFITFAKYEESTPSSLQILFHVYFKRLGDRWHQQHWLWHLSFLENGLGPLFGKLQSLQIQRGNNERR